MTIWYVLIAALIVGRVCREVTFHMDRRSWSAERAELVAQVSAERGEFIALIDRMCQRIQAPDVAVAVQATHELQDAPLKMYASLDDDGDVNGALDELRRMVAQ